jgi:hypothetical protein
MRHWLSRAVVVTCLLLPRTLSAAPIVWQLNGEVTDSPSGNPLEGLLPVGTDVNFLLAVNPAAPDLCGAVGAGLYQLAGAQFAFSGNTYTASNSFLEADNPDGSCVPIPSGTAIRMFFDSAPFAEAVISWGGSGEALPLVPPSSADFWVAFVTQVPAVSGEVTSSAVVPEPSAVPEPSTLLLMVPGLAAIAARRRRLG